MSRYSERIKLLTQHEIVEALRAGPLSVVELAHKLGRGRANVDSYLAPMVEAGHLTVTLGPKPARGPRPVVYGVGLVPLPPVGGPGSVGNVQERLSEYDSRGVLALMAKGEPLPPVTRIGHEQFVEQIGQGGGFVAADYSPIERATQEASQAQKVRESGPPPRWVTPKPPTAQPPLPARPKDLDLGHFGKAAGPVDSLQPGETLEDDDALED